MDADYLIHLLIIDLECFRLCINSINLIKSINFSTLD